MKLLQALLPVLLLTGCASELETYTPALSAGQVAQLRRHTVKFSEAAVSMVHAPETVTLSLLKLEKAEPYRVPVVLGTLNRKSDVRLLLDTGSNQNLLSYRSAVSFQIPIVEDLKPVSAMAIGGMVEDYPALVPSLKFGSMEFRNLPAFVGPETQSMKPADGLILSLSAFKQFSYVTIDSLRGTVTVAPRDPYLPDEARHFVTDVALRWEGALPVIDIAIDQRGSYPCVLDTGGDYGLLFPRERASAFGYWKPGQGKLGTSRGVGGVTLDTIFEARQVKIGGATLVKVPGRVFLVGPEPGSGRFMLGNVVLRQYRVTFDFRRGRLWLER